MRKDSHIKDKAKSDFAEPVFLLLLFICGAVFIYMWLAHYGNSPQVFADAVSELTSAEGSNKSAERNMVYLLSFLGALALIVFYVFFNKGSRAKVPAGQESTAGRMGLYILAMSGISFLVYEECSALLFAAVMLWLLLCLNKSPYTTSAITAYVIIFYALCGIYRLYVYLGGGRNSTEAELALLSFLLVCFLLLYSARSGKDICLKLIPYFQLFIPFSLLIFLSSKYAYNDTVTLLPVSGRIALAVWSLIICFVISAIIKIKKYPKTNGAIDELITFGCLLCIMSFDSYSGCGRIVSSDLHHPFENILSFSQIFELGQKPFSEYIPVSGLYSIVQGAFLFFFGKGEYAAYNVTENLFYLAIAMFIVCAAKRELKGGRALFLALFFPLLRYNRVALILPVMLLLAMPSLIKKRNLWLKIWFLTSLVHGLYYPLFGAAVCIAFLPLAVYQIYHYAKESLRGDIKKPSFWICWLVCIIPAVLCIPLLMGTLKHTLAMSSQTVYADGLSRFGQAVPEGFFPYIQSQGMRLYIYMLFSFLIPVSCVWFSVLAAVKCGGLCLDGRRIACREPVAALLCFAPGIAMFISFSYTFVRLDVFDIYARSAGMIFACAVMFLMLAWRYPMAGSFRKAFIVFAIFLAAAVKAEGFTDVEGDEKLHAAYTVPEGYVQVADESIPRLGHVFIEEGVYTDIKERMAALGEIYSDESYLGIGSFGYYYLYNIRAASLGEIMTVRGYEAACETAQLLKEKGACVSAVDSFAYYYLYRWLLESGEYCWSEAERRFYPSSAGVEAAREINASADIATEERNLGLTPSSWGLSMESLSDIFDIPAGGHALVREGNAALLQGELDGDGVDFLYIELEDEEGAFEYILEDHLTNPVQHKPSAFGAALMRKMYNPQSSLRISWEDDEGVEHGMSCDFGRGKLLIPLGSGAGWLFNSHGGIRIEYYKNGEEYAVPEIKDWRLLKIREVEI